MIIYNITKGLFIIKDDQGKIKRVYAGPLATKVFQRNLSVLFNPKNINHEGLKLLAEQQN